MTVTRENTEIRDQVHEMWAEGTGDIEPVTTDIETLLNNEGYQASNIEIWYDDMQGFWRWNCNIKKQDATRKA